MQVSVTQSFAHHVVADAENNDGERQERDHNIAGVLVHRLSTNRRGRPRLSRGRMSGLMLGAGRGQLLIRSNIVYATEPGRMPIRLQFSCCAILEHSDISEPGVIWAPQKCVLKNCDG